MNYFRSWGSRLKGICNLFHFIGFLKSFHLFAYWSLCFILKLPKGFERFDLKRIYYIEKWLNERYGHLIPETFKSNFQHKSINTKEYIWVFWYQGEENMPDVVKLCYNSICKNSNSHSVNLITKDNINTYINLPNNIINKVEEGTLSIIHLSDILRLNLIYSYGGLWMDCTLFVTAPIEMINFNPLFFSIKNHPLIKGTISNYRWSTFYLYGKQGSPVYKVILDLFANYLNDNTMMIDYFLIDYFFSMLYKKNSEFRNAVDSIPYSNPNLHLLIDELNREYSYDKIKRYYSNTTIFKLNYRPKFYKKINGVISFYGHLKENN